MKASDLGRILDLVARDGGIDFHDYRVATIARRIEHRMAHTGVSDADAYLLRLERDPRELEALAGELVVCVTAFFRDPAVFDALAETVLPALGAGVRAWVIGTATGEEAWSLAMLFASRGRDFEILATDAREDALERARAGIYTAEQVRSVPDPLRARFLRPIGANVSVAHELRSKVCFTRHDITGPRLAPVEAIVASFDLVSCRNLLIYFTERLQATAVERIAAVVRPGGVLVTGTAEQVRPKLFIPYPGLPPELCIFVRTDR